MSATITTGDSPLHIAVRNNNLEEIRKILHNANVDVNVLNSKHESPLHVACYLGHKNIVELLIAFSADPFVKAYPERNYDIVHFIDRLLYGDNLWIIGRSSTSGDSPLHTTVRQGLVLEVKKHIEQKNINVLNSSYETPLHVACALGHRLIVQTIISNGGDLYIRDCFNNTPIHRALSNGYIEIVDDLITIFECNPNVTGYQGRTLLHFACGVGNVEIVTMLIEKYKLSPFALDAIKQTPLHIAASHGQEKVVELLISRYNSHVDCLSRGGYTPLHLACYFGHVNLVKQLVIDFKANSCLFNDHSDMALHLAALGGHVDLIKIIINDFNCCPEVKGFQDRSVLHYSCMNGSVEQTKMLIANFNLDPLYTDKSGNTPLHLACLMGHKELATMLIVEYNCPVNGKNMKLQTPLHLACAAGHEQVTRALVSECRAYVNSRDHQNDTPLNKAVLHNQTSIVRMLVTEFKCNLRVIGFKGRSLLHQACDKGHTELTKILITEFNLDLNASDEEGDQPLHLACGSGHAEVARLLITKYECTIDARNCKNESPLHHACATNSSTTVRVLVIMNADIYARDDDNETPIHKAARYGYTDIVLKMITEYNCSPQVKGFKQRSLLHYACHSGQTQLAVKLVTEFKLDPLAADDHGYTSLHMACVKGHEQLARLLITKYNCSVNAKSLSNETLLHMACAGGHIDVARMLISEFNLDLNVLTSEGCSPLHIAALLGHINIVLALINEFNCKPGTKGRNGRSILHFACNGGNVKLVEILINDFKLDPMSVDDQGNTALHIATENNKEEVLRLLIVKYKCPVDCINSSGQTSLHIAVDEGYIDLCITLISEFCANRNAQDNDNDTPLSIAIKAGNANNVHILAHIYGCKSHTSSDSLAPVLHQVCLDGSVTMLKTLISNFGYDPASVDQDGNTVLHTAAQRGRYDLVHLIITTYSGYCPIDSRNLHNETPLHLACIAGHAEVAELLFVSGAMINLKDKDEESPLKKAWRMKQSDVIRRILHILSFNSPTSEIIDSSLLYHVCQHGFTELLDVLLSDFYLDPCSVLDEEGNTPLHIASLYRQKEIAMLLVNSGYPIEWRNFNGQNPIHLLCSNTIKTSTESLLKWFVYELKVDIHEKDKNGDQPIHLSAQCGCTNTLAALILNYGCDPEAGGFRGRPVIHQALFNGHVSTAKALIELFNVSVHSIDIDGNTPLHVSSLTGQHESVSLLLYDYHVPIYVRNKSGETAVDLARDDLVKKVFQEYISSKHHTIQLEYKELQLWSQKKYAGEQKIMRVFVLGHPESGKSTLVESLKRKGISSLVKLPESKVPSHTAGIIPSLHQRNGTTRLLYFDFAGDKEYYSSHSAILEMVSKSSVGSLVYVIVANLTKESSTIHTELGYWLSFISYHTNVNDTAKVIIVLSHSDLLNSTDAANKSDETKQYMFHYISQWNLDVIDVIASNCRKPRSSRTLDNIILQQLSNETLPYAMTFKSTMLNGLLEKDFQNVIACKFQDILSHIKDAGINLPTSASTLYPVVKELHDIGLLMMVGRSEDQIEDYLVVMNMSSLTNEVHQLLFSKSAMQTLEKSAAGKYTKMGIFPERVISSILPHHITKECLIQLQYCHEFTHAEVDLDYTVTPNLESDNLLLYFPAMCKLKSEQRSWPPDPDLDFSIGWYAKCMGKLDFLPQRFLHVLLLRLTFMFALLPGSLQTSDLDLSLSVPKENCHCTMWKNGIHWLMSEGIDCIAEVVDESRGVVVVVKSRKKHTYQCVHLLSQIVNVVNEAKNEFCFSVSFKYHIMNSNNPSSYSNEDKLYEISKIRSALLNKDETVTSDGGHLSLDLENLNFINCHTYWGCYFSLKASVVLEYIEEVVDERESFGLALQLPYHVIQSIEMGEIDVELKRKELIRRWMCSTKLCGTACWWFLVKALEDRMVMMNVAAARIRERYGDIISIQEKLLEPQYSNEKPDDEFLQSFAKVVGNRWPSLGSLLALSMSDIESIKREKGNLPQVKQAHHMLKKWSLREEATYGQLLERLKTVSLLRT